MIISLNQLQNWGKSLECHSDLLWTDGIEEWCREEFIRLEWREGPVVKGFLMVKELVWAICQMLTYLMLALQWQQFIDNTDDIIRFI